MTEVQRVTTPLTHFQMGQALIVGHRRYFGTGPGRLRLAVAWAHCALEHAAGAKLYNFNFGNVTAGAKYEGDIYVMKVPPPDPPVLRFRSFETADEGAIDYWSMLAGHYRPALALFDQGAAFDAAIMLGALGYYTANPASYSRGVVNWFKWYDRELAASFVDELAEGSGNSSLSQQEIDEVLAKVDATSTQFRPADAPAGIAELDELEPIANRETLPDPDEVPTRVERPKA